MPRYRAPSLYIQEIRFRPPAIQRQETRFAAFLGPARQGPLNRLSRPLHSYSDFQRSYGDTTPLDFGDGGETVNYLAYAAKAFFEEGGHRLRVVRVRGGFGAPPDLADYQKGLAALAKCSDFLLLAAPGASAIPALSEAVRKELIQNCEAFHPLRMALIDPDRDDSPRHARMLGQRFDSRYGAVYYPWLSRASPSGPIILPPSGSLAGIIHRVDTHRGVHKAPANESIRSADGLSRSLSSQTADLLTAAGVNCLRSFPGRGLLVWGARTASSDLEWRYLNMQRLALHLEHSLQAGLHWTASEPHKAKLWAQARSAAETFMYSLWRDGALLGRKPEEAYFVRCDRTTMTEKDINNKILRLHVGFAPLKPAEFTIIQLTLPTS